MFSHHAVLKEISPSNWEIIYIALARSKEEAMDMFLHQYPNFIQVHNPERGPFIFLKDINDEEVRRYKAEEFKK